jgi:hypothetical protein
VIDSISSAVASVQPREQRPHGAPPGLDAAASALDLSAADLRASLSKGTSIADIAAGKGVSKATLVAAVEKGLEASAPSNAPRGIDYAQTAEAIVSQKGLPKPSDSPGAPAVARSRSAATDDPFEAASNLLGVSKSELLSELEAGKSFGDPLAAKGLTVQTLVHRLGQNGSVAIDTLA